MQYLNTEQVRDMLGFKNVETVRRMVKRGVLKASVPHGGRGYRFKISDVTKAMKTCSTDPEQKEQPT